ncbi:MAG: DDE-type integrase/transposase/recombinase [Comamonadaceae bacterium]|nr:DDE-type integrase/transposase/recombinase [Comamonadaceae bacterium]
MPPAAHTEVLLHIKQQADAAGHGHKERIYQAACQQYGWALPTLKRWLSQLGAARARKRRSDAGACALTLEHAQMISAALMEGYRANKKKGAALSGTLEKLRANVPGLACALDAATGELRPLSASAVSRALRHYRLHPEQLRRAAPAQPLRSEHPNEVWQIDASISILFYVPDEGGLQAMARAQFNKNKPGNFERIKRQRLTRYVITDHYSGSIFVHYVAGGESTVNMAEAFLRCIAQRPGQQMYGVPFHLMMDPGSAGTAGAFGNLLRRLQVAPIVNQVGNARAKGQVENAHNLVEVDFESGFRLTHVPGIDWINQQAARWMRYYNSQRVHSRHGAPRWMKWMEITPAQLRVVDAALARELLTHAPATPKVDVFLQVRFAGRVWDVSGVGGVMVGERLAITYNPFNPAAAYVLLRDADGHEQLLEVPEVEKNAAGFAASAAHIAHEYKRPADTTADTQRKAIERLAMQAYTDAQAEAARKAKALPFGGRIDPYKHLEQADKLALLPRRGTELAPAASARSDLAERTLTHFEAAQALRAQHGVEMDKAKFAQLAAWHPNGVPEGQLPELAHKLAVRATLRVVGGH